MAPTREAYREMVTECSSYYRTRQQPRQLAEVADFVRRYTSDAAITWYTKACFLHRLLNKALRSDDITALWTFRYFIRDLCSSLANRKLVVEAPLSLYRGAKLARSELEQLRIGSLVSTNGFLSTSRRCDVAALFAGSNVHREDPYQCVMFEVEIQPNVSAEAVFADISALSEIPDESEVLFDLGTLFEITDLHLDTIHEVWHIHLRLSAEIPLQQ
ncbi:unnamed protein product [Didymodactylos carnosus]|uniref:NAD(P)(+)--arginine ADP-ribosyltransferase n=1 Tax=Didymodactylos carnosus TaxID=1234261 RepID=A0A814XXY6_9BILA|nr:unnamed protein product [Didymodactylos carnosus]CAF3985175.1 unnamed protein product [Didymodactylos carnosus]